MRFAPLPLSVPCSGYHDGVAWGVALDIGGAEGNFLAASSSVVSDWSSATGASFTGLTVKSTGSLHRALAWATVIAQKVSEGSIPTEVCLWREGDIAATTEANCAVGALIDLRDTQGLAGLVVRAIIVVAQEVARREDTFVSSSIIPVSAWATGASFTAPTVMVKLCSALWLTSPLAVSPSSWSSHGNRGRAVGVIGRRVAERAVGGHRRLPSRGEQVVVVVGDLEGQLLADSSAGPGRDVGSPTVDLLRS